MGRHFWMKHVHDESHDKQPGCMWGLVNVLDYHHWRSNVRKMIQHRKNEGQTHLKCDWSPASRTYNLEDPYEAEKLLDEEQSSSVGMQKYRAAKKRSLKTRIKALIAEEIPNDSEKRQGKNFERTYSIHHLESLDSKTRGRWKHPIIFLPRNVENSTPQSNKDAARYDPDVLEIFNVDKELLIKHLQDADPTVANFSHSALGLNRKAKFSKSKSFPVVEVPQRRKFKPMKLENKQKEVWSVPKEDKLQQAESSEKPQQNHIMKRTYRSSSLNESLDKYARLFENSFRKDANLSSSKSLKLTNEYGHAPVYVRRIRSLSNVDTYYPSSSFETFGDDPSGNGSVLSIIESGSLPRDCEEENIVIEEDDESLRLHMGTEDCEKAVSLDDEEETVLKPETNCCDVSVGKLDLQNDEISDNIIESFARDDYPKGNDSDMHYVRHLLDQSRIAVDASEIIWYASDQLLGPQFFEEVESCWTHEQDKSTEDIWYHQMLFDLVNDVLVEVYDMSLSYYPKALSSSCRVRTFPVGNHIIEEVATNIGSMLNLKPEEKQSLDGIIARDMTKDYQWMNLQLDTECVALDLEDRIFNELLEEVMLS